MFVGKDGLWHGPQASGAEMVRQLARPAKDLLVDGMKAGGRAAPTSEIVDSFFSAWHAAGADVLFPIVHGTFGEDGVVQGLFEALGVPYVGCGVAASAVGMDKIFMKAAFAAAGLPQVRYVALSRAEWTSPASRASIVTRIDGLGVPVFVKPACAGSSVGITKVREEAAARERGRQPRFAWTPARSPSRASTRARSSAPCSRARRAAATEASVPGEIVPGHEFYDYEDKYIDSGARSVIPADLPASTREEIRRLAARAFDVIGGEGFARVDFFLERGTQRILVNEINSLPGFTPISMFPKMWEASGLALPRLLDRLVKSAFRRPSRGR